MAAILVLVVADARCSSWATGSLDPMHGDEAVNTYKFAQLWTGYRGGTYRYDPHEYHGPTLPYLTLPMAWMSATQTYAQTDEAFYRRLTALAGLALVAITLACAGAVGRPAALLGAALVAVSLAMIFYSRFYIHEMFLVLFTAAAMVVA